MPYTNAVHKLLPLENVRYRAVHICMYAAEKNDPEMEDAHIHNCYEFYINVSGDVSFLVDHTLYPICSGDVLLIQPGTLHHCISNSACTHDHFCLWMYVDGELERQILSTSPPRIFGIQGAERDALFVDLEILSGEQNNLAKTSAFLRVMELLLGEHRPQVTASVELPPALQSILDYIDENLSEINRIDEILPIFYISRSTLNRWFRRYIHLTPHAFLEAKKLAYAQQLLERNLSITEIAEKAGFSDCSHFIATFKKKFGQSPAQYRKRNTSQ